jgi:hypothetical protein
MDITVNNDTDSVIDQDGFDDFAIESLFGEIGETDEVTDTARVLPPFHGNYRLLVARPAYALYYDEDGTEWVAAMAEIHVHYRVGSFPRTHVFSHEQIDGVLANSRGRDWRARGNLVRKLEIRDEVFDCFQKRLVGVWDLKNSQGRLVSGGTYMVRGLLETANNERIEVVLLVGVR